MAMALPKSATVVVRVSGIRDSLTEEDLAVHFSNPRNGGGRVHKIFYPLMGNDAVIFFDSDLDVSRLCRLHTQSPRQSFSVRPLPNQVFSKIEAELLPAVSALVSNNNEIMEELCHYTGCHLSSLPLGGRYKLVGDIYQIEWAMQYLDNVIRQMTDMRPKNPIATQSDEEREVCKTDADDDNEKLNPEQVNTTTRFNEMKDTHSHNSQIMELQNEDVSVSTDLGNYYEQLRAKMEEIKLEENLYAPSIQDRARAVIDFDSEDDENEVSSYNSNQYDDYTPPPYATYADFDHQTLTFDFQVKTILVKIIHGDVLKSKTDGIVSPADITLTQSFGLASVIARTAGTPLIEDCRKIIQKHGMLKVGDIVHTRAGGALDKRVGSVLHAVVPAWTDSESEKLSHMLTVTYMNCMQYANLTLWMESLTFPLIGAGLLGIPLDVCVQSFHDALQLIVLGDKQLRHLSEIQLVSNDTDSVGAVIVIMQSLLEMEEGSDVSSAVERYITHSDKYNFYANDFQLMDPGECHKSNPEKEVTSDHAEGHVMRKNPDSAYNRPQTNSTFPADPVKSNDSLKPLVYPTHSEPTALSTSDDSYASADSDIDTCSEVSNGIGYIENNFDTVSPSISGTETDRNNVKLLFNSLRKTARIDDDTRMVDDRYSSMPSRIENRTKSNLYPRLDNRSVIMKEREKH